MFVPDAECHAHISLEHGSARRPGEFDRGEVRSRLRAYQLAGITFVRDGGDRSGAGVFASQVAAEHGIDFRTPVCAIHLAGMYGSGVGEHFTDAKDLGRLIRDVSSRGADFIKLMASGIMDFSAFGAVTAGPLGEDLMREACRVAHSEGLAVMVHVNGASQICAAVEAGCDSIEHGYYQDAASIEAIASSGAVWVPTLAPLANIIGRGVGSDRVISQILALQGQDLVTAAGKGAIIAAGSDAGAAFVAHGQGILDEARLLAPLEEECPRLEAALKAGQARIKRIFRKGM